MSACNTGLTCSNRAACSVFQINAGVCDEVVRLEEHIAKAKEERRSDCFRF